MRRRGKRIVISYRRGSTAGHAGRLRDAVDREFRGKVFLDVDSIEPGEDFMERLRNEVQRADVVIALIGQAHGDR